MNNLEQEFIFPDPTLGNPIEYPFYDIRNESTEFYLRKLRVFITPQWNEAGDEIQPLDFTKYTTTALRNYFGNPHGDFMPLFFYHHWVGHPEKRSKDMLQRTTDENVDSCVWKRFGRSYDYPYGVNEDGIWPGASKMTFRLAEAVSDHPEDWLRFRIDVYRLPNYVYNPPLQITDVKKSNWAVVKLYVPPARGRGRGGRGMGGRGGRGRGGRGMGGMGGMGGRGGRGGRGMGGMGGMGGRAGRGRLN